MVDIHTHILPNIDDGSSCKEMSLAILQEAEKCGVTDLIFTPHFIFGSKYDLNNAKKETLLKSWKRVAKKNKININLYLGNEIFVTNEIINLIKDNKIKTLNDSKYILFELPLNNDYNGLDNLIFDLRRKGYRPILAHPERYTNFQKNPSLLMDLLDKGLLLQVNVGSFFGFYGKKAKELVSLLAKHKMIHFFGSDVHYDNSGIYDNVSNLYSKLSKYYSQDEINDLLTNNALKVINNQNIITLEYIPFKKSFGKWK